jgi:hypothetical protein
MTMKRHAASGLVVSLLLALGAGSCDSLMRPGLSAGTGSLAFTVTPGPNSVRVPMKINQGYFAIDLSDMSHGSVTANAPAAFPNTPIALTATPATGYALKAGTLKCSYGGSDYTPSGSGLFVVKVAAGCMFPTALSI